MKRHSSTFAASGQRLVTDSRRIGNRLQDRFNEDVREPLPRRWVDLIRHLNEKEPAEPNKGQGRVR